MRHLRRWQCREATSTSLHQSGQGWLEADGHVASFFLIKGVLRDHVTRFYTYANARFDLYKESLCQESLAKKLATTGLLTVRCGGSGWQVCETRSDSEFLFLVLENMLRNCTGWCENLEIMKVPRSLQLCLGKKFTSSFIQSRG